MILVINGPNLNRLGSRDPSQYGTQTLANLERALAERAEALGASVRCFQSNHEGAIVDFIQKHGAESTGIIINAGALTQVGYSILDALLDANRTVIEVHVSNIHGREAFRKNSVIAPFARGQIAGLGLHGYLYALDYLVTTAREEGAH